MVVRIFCQYARSLKIPNERLEWLALGDLEKYDFPVTSAEEFRALYDEIFSPAILKSAKEWNQTIMDVWISLQLSGPQVMRARISAFLIPNSLSYLGAAICDGLGARLYGMAIHSTYLAAFDKPAGTCMHGNCPVPAEESTQVIQDVTHPVEPIATRDETLLTLQANQEWADDLLKLQRIQEEQSSATFCVDGKPALPRESNRVHLISFRSGQGELFRKMLLEDKEFRPLLKSLRDARCPLMLQPSKTIVLVRPDQYLDTVNSPTLAGKVLKRYNVIVAESEGHLMD